jgi:glycosyltransferase involved in cell wall biosynthesis
MYSFSVLISLYKNDVPLSLSQTLESIWDKQSLKPQKIILVVDGPIDVLLEECIGFHKNRIGDILDVLRLEFNMGLGIALNEGLKLVQTDYVARIDCDDLAEPDRFARQVDYAARHPDLSVISSFMNVVDYQGTFLYTRKVPISQAFIHLRAKFSSPIAHPVAFLKLHDVLTVGGYPNFRRSQDMVLCAKLIRAGFKIQNMSDILGTYKRPKLGLLKRLKLNFSDVDALSYLRKHRFINFFHMGVIFSIRFLKSFTSA